MNMIFTVCNRLTLANALVLADSVNRYEPDTFFCLCWVDTQPVPMLSSDIRIIEVSEVVVPGWKEMCQYYFDFELLAASRPWFASFLFVMEPEIEILTFLAPTTWLLGSIGSVPSDVDLVLTPNILRPLSANTKLDDKRILNIGMFNAGAWSLRKSENTTDFLIWWSNRTFDRAKFDLCNGMCMDQLWLNYAPVWIPKTNFRRDSSWHYGLRSVPDHHLVSNGEAYWVGNERLISLDFSGLAGFDPVWSTHSSLLSVNTLFRSLFKEYQRKVRAIGIPVTDIASGYGKVAVRNIFRERIIALANRAIGFIDSL